MPRISVVVPTLDEADEIVAALTPLQSLRTAGHEIIVVDGGSRDATLARAVSLADRTLIARRGRALQMNAGAAAATGDVVLFLHADSRLMSDAIVTLAIALGQSRRRWGRFDVAITGRFQALRVVAALMNLRSRLTGIATGDQGIFVERALFDAVGGYPDQPLMEDIELSRRLKRAGGAPLCLRTRILTSGRRWERDGLWRTIVAMWQLRFAYWCGVDAIRLAVRYPVARASIGNPPPAPTLQVFAKAPVPGTVKTRLARAVGKTEAAAIHAELVERTLATAVAARTAGIVGAIELWCAPDTHDPAFAAWRDRYRVRLATQAGNDLGERMRNALGDALDRGTPAILVGSDCPVLGPDYLACAASALRDHDAVFGPAEDGGYVLVGLARRVDAFAGITWSGPRVMETTRAQLLAQQASWQELPVLWDVDNESDLVRWRALAPRPAISSVAAIA